jgi:hypothetical protein
MLRIGSAVPIDERLEDWVGGGQLAVGHGQSRPTIETARRGLGHRHSRFSMPRPGPGAKVNDADHLTTVGHLTQALTDGPIEQ